MVDLRRVSSSDIEVVLQGCHREGKFPSIGYSREGSRSRAETSEEQVIEMEERRTDIVSQGGVNESQEQYSKTCADSFKNVANLSK